MKTTFTRSLSFAFVLTGVLGMQACIKEGDPAPCPVTGEMTDISFTARMPSVATVETRGETGTVAENKIDDIHILVFETTGELVYKGKAKNLMPSGVDNNTIAFKATLPVGKTYDFVVLANAESLLSGINAGAATPMTRSDVEAVVQQTTTTNSENGKWKTSVAIPMWDEQRMELTASSAPTFYLMRMLARINVEYTPAAGADVFRLTAIRYYNYNTSGKIVPTANMTGTEGDRHVTMPTLPADPGTRTGESLEYTAITGYKTCKNLIYVFEAGKKGEYGNGNDNWIDNPCLVVGGRYDSDKDGDFDEESETWYRIDFIKKTPAEQWLSLLRNFSYNVTVTSVSGAGYSDPDVALESVPMNMNAEIIDWNDGKVGDIEIDGPNFLSVGDSRNEGLRKAASLYRNATSTDEIEFNTNIALDRFKWALTEGGAEVEPTAEEKAADVVAKIANEFYEIKIVKGDVVNGVNYGKFVFTALKNYAASNPVSTLTVTSGRIQYTISISQRDANPQDWDNGGNKEEILG